MGSKIITLLSDFGCEDGFVAEMKGSILTRLPSAILVDITHAIPAYDVWSAALVMGRVYRRFPAGTIHLAVVDPGTGGKRKPIIVKASGYLFVGPDNGLFSLPIKQASHYQAYQIHPLPGQVTPTFHGRDLFAPIAAELAAGISLARIGKKISQIECLPDMEPLLVEPGHWRGRVTGFDHFGNVATNFPASLLRILSQPEVRIRKKRIGRIIRAFCEGRTGHLYLLENSDGFVEIVQPSGSAWKKLGCRPGERVDLISGLADEKLKKKLVVS